MTVKLCQNSIQRLAKRSGACCAIDAGKGSETAQSDQEYHFGHRTLINGCFCCHLLLLERALIHACAKSKTKKRAGQQEERITVALINVHIYSLAHALARRVRTASSMMAIPNIVNSIKHVYTITDV